MKVLKKYPNYAVTESGDVYRVDTMRKLKQTKRHGYLEVNLFNNGNHKIEKVHRLVAITFIENPNSYPCVNHKDEDKTNNNVENLEWCTYKYNNNYGKNRPVNNLRLGSIKNRKRVAQLSLNNEYITEYVSVREAGRKTGFNQSNIVKCCNGKAKQAYGYRWIYTAI